MSLRDQARTDFRNNLTTDGDPIILVHETAGAFTFSGQITRIDTHFDPQTGTQVYEPKLILTVSYDDLPDGWTPQQVTGFECQDTTGATITGHTVTHFRDLTLGFINFVCEPLDEVIIEEEAP